MTDAKIGKIEKVEKPAEPNDGKAAGVGPEGRAVGAGQVADAQNARTNASDGSLGKYSAAAQERSIELVSDDKIVSRKNALRERDLVGPRVEGAPADAEHQHTPIHLASAQGDAHSSQAMERAQTIAQKNQHIDHLGLGQAQSFKAGDLNAAPKPAAMHAETRPVVESDAAGSSRHHDLAHELASLKKLKDDTAAHIEDPRLKQEFSNNLEKFQARKDIDQAEKDRVYMQLSRLLTTKDTKLVGIDMTLVRKDGHVDGADKNLSREDAAEKDAVRVSLAEGLIYHAAHPSRVDQGNFNTCNVSTLAERVFTRHPSIAAEMAVTTAIKGEWVNPRDPTHQVIKIDRESLRPAEFGCDNVPPPDGLRSFDIQLLNVVMINDFWQREIPPAKYMQTRPGMIVDDITGRQIKDCGENLNYWDAAHDKCYGPVTTPADTAHGVMMVPFRSPHLNGEKIAEEGAQLTGESHFVITNSPPEIDRLTGRPIDDGMVHVTSPDMLRQTLIEMKVQKRFPAVICVDAHNAIFERPGECSFDPHSGHVVSIRDYDDTNGRVVISNQWGAKDDIKANLADVYDASVWNYKKTGDWQYELEKWKVKQFGNIEVDKDS